MEAVNRADAVMMRGIALPVIPGPCYDPAPIRPSNKGVIPVTVNQILPVTEAVEGDVRIAVGFATDQGGRADNEDAVYVGELPAAAATNGGPGLLLAVADGMGGHDGGEIASRIAIQTLQETLATGTTSDAEMARLLKHAFRLANERIFAQGQARGPDDGMGTTLVAAATRGKYATIASVGDSRAYLVRANRLTQITRDHSLVAEQVAQGSLTADEARSSPQRNILTHALGQRDKLDSKLPGIYEITLLADDRLLLCSDGFYDVASDDDLLGTVLSADPDEAALRLVALAKERGTTDNVTAVIASVHAARIREPVPIGAEGTRPSALVPVLAALAAILIIAVVVYLFFL